MVAFLLDSVIPLSFKWCGSFDFLAPIFLGYSAKTLPRPIILSTVIFCGSRILLPLGNGAFPFHNLYQNILFCFSHEAVTGHSSLTTVAVFE